jgi:hypothetical protein
MPLSDIGNSKEELIQGNTTVQLSHTSVVNLKNDFLLPQDVDSPIFIGKRNVPLGNQFFRKKKFKKLKISLLEQKSYGKLLSQSIKNTEDGPITSPLYTTYQSEKEKAVNVNKKLKHTENKVENNLTHITAYTQIKLPCWQREFLESPVALSSFNSKAAITHYSPYSGSVTFPRTSPTCIPLSKSRNFIKATYNGTLTSSRIEGEYNKLFTFTPRGALIKSKTDKTKQAFNEISRKNFQTLKRMKTLLTSQIVERPLKKITLSKPDRFVTKIVHLRKKENLLTLVYFN